MTPRQKKMRAIVGIVGRRGDVFRGRLFLNHVQLPRRWDEYYWRRVKTLIYGDRQVEHRCKYAR